MLTKTHKLQNLEWNCIKIPLGVIWMLRTLLALWEINSITNNKGVCIVLNCNLIALNSIKITFSILILVFLILYVLEIKMLFTTFSLFILSLVVFSAHESYGISARSGVFTLIFFVQFIAYYLYRTPTNSNHLAEKRILFPIQLLTAAYTLSAISKIKTSGLSWFYNSHYSALQILKSNQMEYLDGLLYHSSAIVTNKVDFILEHSWFISIMLLFALLIELFSGLAIINKRYHLYVGIALLFMHIGIYIILEIVIISFFFPMVLFMINPLYLFLSKVKKT